MGMVKGEFFINANREGIMKRYLMAGLVFCLCGLIMITPAVAKKKPIKIRFSHVVADNTPKGWAAKEFARRVNEELAGQVEVQVFPNAQLYGDNQAIEALSAGFIEMAAPATAKYVGSIPQLQLFDMPFLFPSINATYKVIDGAIGQEISDLFTKRGLKQLAYWDNGFKHFSSSKCPLLAPADFKGQKFRIQSSDILEAQMKQLGATGLKLPFAEVYNALEQGVVDGQENTASNIYSKKFHEVQKHLTVSNHGYIGYVVVTTERFWNSLPQDIQTRLERIMKEVTLAERKMAMEMNMGDLARIREYAEKSKRLQIYELEDQQKAKMKQALEPVHKMMPEVVPVRWVDEIYQMK